jgi:hypothetical protein
MNLSGSFMLALMFRITPLPSKLKTAMPKNIGMLVILRYRMFSWSYGSSTYSSLSYDIITIRAKTMDILANNEM